MLLRIAIVISLVFAAAGVVCLLIGRRAVRRRVTAMAAVRVGSLALGMGAWLALASTVLLWIFPLNVLLTLGTGYFGTRRALEILPRSEVRASVLMAFALGVGVAAAITSSADSFLTHVAGPYSLLNALVFACAAYLVMRLGKPPGATPT